MSTSFVVVFALAGALCAQELAPDTSASPASAPLQLSVPQTTYSFGSTSGTLKFDPNPVGRRFVIEYVSARCLFSYLATDRAGEIVLTTQDARGKTHQFNLRVRHVETAVPDRYASVLSYVADPVRIYHDGGADGAAPLQITFRFSGYGLRAPAACQAEVSGYTVAK